MSKNREKTARDNAPDYRPAASFDIAQTGDTGDRQSTHGHEQAFSKGPKPALQTLMQRGVKASEMGDKAAAYASFKELVTYYPDSLEGWVWLGWTSPDAAEAEAAFQQAYKLDPSSDEATLGLRWATSQREEEAAATVSSPLEAVMLGMGATATGPLTNGSQHTSDVLITTGAADLEPGRLAAHTGPLSGSKRPSGSLEKLTGTGPLVTGPLSNGHNTGPLGRATRTGPLGEGSSTGRDQSNFQPPFILGPVSLEEGMRRGVSAAQSGDRFTAYTVFRQLAEQYPSVGDVWVWLAGTGSSLDEAGQNFRRALDVDPTNEQAALGLRWVALRRQALSRTGSEPSARGTSPSSTPLNTGSLGPARQETHSVPVAEKAPSLVQRVLKWLRLPTSALLIVLVVVALVAAFTLTATQAVR